MTIVRSIDDRRELRAARSIAKTLFPAETSLDTTIVDSAKLIATIAQARIDAGAPAETGHTAFMLAAGSLASLVEAKDRLVHCHRELAHTRDVRGLDEEQVGCTAGKGGRPSAEASERVAA